MMGVIIFLCFICTAFVDRQQTNQWKQKKELTLRSTAKLCKIRLEKTIQTRFNAIESIASLFLIHNGTTPEQFGDFAQSLIRYNPPIRALQYADPQTRVTYVYPPKGNEITIKKPMLLLEDPKRGPFVKKAMEERRAVMQGPFNLRQGGMGVVVRLPIFKGDTFLGLAIGVFDLPKLIDEALIGIPLDQYIFQIKNQEGEVFYGKRHLSGQTWCESFTIASSSWRLCTAWAPYTLTPPITLRLIIWGSGLVFILSLLIFSKKNGIQSKYLQQLVDERTETLVTMNNELTQKIAERNIAVAALHESEVKFRTIADFTYDWEYWIDPDNRFRYISPSCQRITGHSPDAFHQNPDLLRELIHPDDRAAFSDHLKQNCAHPPASQGIGNSDNTPASHEIDNNDNTPAAHGIDNCDNTPATHGIDNSSNTPASHEIVFRIVTKQGEERWISHVCQSVFGEEGIYLGKRASNRDITDHRRLQQQSIKAHKMEMVGRLAGGIAHQFNNALSVILGYLDLMTSELPDDGAEKDSDIAAMKAAAQKMHGLTTQLLAYARGGKYLTRSLSLKEFIQETLPIITHDISQAISLSVHCSEHSCRIEADPTQLQMVLSSILMNAIEAMGAEGSITVSCRRETVPEGGIVMDDVAIPAGIYAAFSITDTGMGMDDETRKRVFEPFYSTKFEGRGLGLAAAFGIIKNHNGFITVNSKPGHGTTVTVFLPALLGASSSSLKNRS